MLIKDLFDQRLRSIYQFL